MVLCLILNFGRMTKGFFTSGKMISRFCDSMIYGWIRYWADVNIGENEFSRDIIWLKYGQHMPINIWPYNICAEHNKENKIKYSILFWLICLFVCLFDPDLVVGTPEEFNTLCHSSLLSFPEVKFQSHLITCIIKSQFPEVREIFMYR